MKISRHVTQNLDVVTVWFTFPGVEVGVHRSSTEKLLKKDIACDASCFNKVVVW